MTSRCSSRFVILIPVYNDWASVFALLGRLDRLAQHEAEQFSVVVVDDGSVDPLEPSGQYDALESVVVVHLCQNLGHQRAIAVGLTYVHGACDCDAIIVMDADGEDRPEDLPRLVDEFQKGGSSGAVFARRRRRSEGLVFRSFYVIYRALFYFMTGRRVRMGNFSLLPESYLGRVVGASDLWNHYMATIIKSNIPYVTVDCDRGQRSIGQSKMNYANLIVHGLSAIAVFSDIVAVRMLCVAALSTLTCLTSVVVVAGLRLFTDWAIPGWASTLVGLGVVAMMQSLTMSAFFAFLVLADRSKFGFLPRKDCKYFIDKVESLHLMHASQVAEMPDFVNQ